MKKIASLLLTTTFVFSITLRPDVFGSAFSVIENYSQLNSERLLFSNEALSVPVQETIRPIVFEGALHQRQGDLARFERKTSSIHWASQVPGSLKSSIERILTEFSLGKNYYVGSSPNPSFTQTDQDTISIFLPPQALVTEAGMRKEGKLGSGQEGPAGQALRQLRNQFLRPLETPVQFIFSEHNGSAVNWMTDQVLKVLTGYEPNRPITLWVEQAHPSTLPSSVPKLQTFYNQYLSGKSNWQVDLGKELMTKPLNPRLEKLLIDAFNVCASEEQPIETILRASSDSKLWADGILELVDSLRKEDRRIALESENAPFDSYLNHLLGQLSRTALNKALFEGHFSEAYFHAGNSQRYYALNISKRDQGQNGLAHRIASYSRKHPLVLNIVLRGTAHRKTIEEALENENILYRSVAQGSTDLDLARSFEAFPDFETPRGRGYAAAYLIGLTASTLSIGLPSSEVTVLESLFGLSEGISLEGAEQWFNELRLMEGMPIFNAAVWTLHWVVSHAADELTDAAILNLAALFDHPTIGSYLQGIDLSGFRKRQQLILEQQS